MSQYSGQFTKSNTLNDIGCSFLILLWQWTDAAARGVVVSTLDDTTGCLL
jgi:hypothetical protein